MNDEVFGNVLRTLEEIKRAFNEYAKRYTHVRDSAYFEVFMEPYYAAHVSALNQLVSWADVERTHAVLAEEMVKCFAIRGNVAHVHFVPCLIPTYEAHKTALERLFLIQRRDVRESGYYCGIKQLHDHGRRTDKHGREICGVPELPDLEHILCNAY